MNKYEQGIYLIKFFDKYGSSHGDDLHGVNYTQSLRIGHDVKQSECQVNSFTVMRVLHNSLDIKFED